MSIITDNLFEKTLIDPIRNGANELCIVSGYATATMATRHIEAVRRELKQDIAIRVIVGMCSQDGIQKSQHLGFQKLSQGEFNTDFKCGYITDRPPIHSKVYTWLRDGEPILGFMGSANYTQNAFSKSMREVLTEKNALDCFGYYQSLIDKTIDCLSDDVSNFINLFDQRRAKGNLIIESELETSISTESNLDKVTLTLLEKRTGEVPARSGLNWGQRPEHGRNPNQAYLNIPSKIGSSGFFPERFEQFMVLTDDNKELICVRAQDNGKAIHTTLDNSRMGEYFRYRLGLPNGAFITKDDLLRYGRTDVDFHKIDDETYLMDFSVH